MWIKSEEDKTVASTWGATIHLKAEEAVEEVVEESTEINFESMTKVQLEEYGRTIGIELDRRKKKSALIEELKAAE